MISSAVCARAGAFWDEGASAPSMETAVGSRPGRVPALQVEDGLFPGQYAQAETVIVRSAKVIVYQEITESFARRILKRVHLPAAAMQRHLRRKHTKFTGIASSTKNHLIVFVQRHPARTLSLIIDDLH